LPSFTCEIEWAVSYFEGIQGENAKKGELFGIENIFKLHEDKLATKMAVSVDLSTLQRKFT